VIVMTVAVCIQCGAIKHGAWTSCPECSSEPTDRSDIQISISQWQIESAIGREI